MTLRVDLNCDLGEGYGHWRLGDDDTLLWLVSSASVACGLHAGDPATMRRTVARARERGVAVGAHPGLPDLLGMGRRHMEITPQEAHDMVLYQVGALDAFVRAAGGRLQHVKAHGALYGMIGRDGGLAEAVVKAVQSYDPSLIILGQPGSALDIAAAVVKAPFAAELFADRTYTADGSLTPRTAGSIAFVSDPEEAADRMVNAVREGFVTAVTGERVVVRAATICVHGDGEHAVSLAKSVRQALESDGIEIAPLVKQEKWGK
jgi:UPF0271 protein